MDVQLDVRWGVDRGGQQTPDSGHTFYGAHTAGNIRQTDGQTAVVFKFYKAKYSQDRENVPFASPENLVARDGLGCPVPRQLAHFSPPG